MESGSDEVDQDRRCQHARQHQRRGEQGENCEDSAGDTACFFLFFAGQKVGINRNERSGQHTFAKKVLQKVRNTQRGAKGIGGIGIAEIVSEDAVANQARDTTEKNPGSHQRGGRPGFRNFLKRVHFFSRKFPTTMASMPEE